MRNRYDRMTAAELSAALDALHLSAGRFARLCGHQRKRVLSWLDDTEQIPHHVYVMTETWLAFPRTLAFAREVTDAAIIEQEEESDEAEITLP